MNNSLGQYSQLQVVTVKDNYGMIANATITGFTPNSIWVICHDDGIEYEITPKDIELPFASAEWVITQFNNKMRQYAYA